MRSPLRKGNSDLKTKRGNLMQLLKAFGYITLFAAWTCSIVSAQGAVSLRFPEEIHLRNIRQITFGGENAEAYFSFDEKKLIFQSTRDTFKCDQIFSMNLDGSEVRLLSTGKGKTTCAYFLPDGTSFIYSSTHHRSATCPPPPDYSKGYVWHVNPDYDVFLARNDGRTLIPLTTSDGYDAEATVSAQGDKIVFTSMRDGDLDLYSMNIDGSNVQRLTHEIGYDGGAFYSWDGKMIVYRAHHPRDSSAIADYQSLLKQGFVRPAVMELYVMDADGSNKRQITDFGAASFAPFFHPDNRRIIFASNMHNPKGRNFDLYLINIDGSGLKRVTFNDTFDGFPMFTRDGKRLVFASNRNARVRGETNIFIADWFE
jgi:TolB protein